MKTYTPNYYAAFHCIADRCRHSCCMGWEIMIDDAALSLYHDLEGELGEKLRRNITENEDGASFRLNAEERCPFLQADGLCELICKGGEALLCDICALHPRYFNELPTRDECGLGFSCEEACRVILSSEAPMALIPSEDPDELYDEGFDEGFDEDGDEDLNEDPGETLTEAAETDPEEQEFLLLRQAVLSLVQDRALSFDQRLLWLKEQYMLPPAPSFARAAALLLPLEHLEADWAADLEALSMLRDADPAPLQPFDNAFEQFISGLIYRHFRRVFDGEDLRAVLAFVVFSVQAVRLLSLLTARRQGALTFEDLCDLVRRYSSEIEYSDENVDRLIDALSEELP